MQPWLALDSLYSQGELLILLPPQPPGLDLTECATTPNFCHVWDRVQGSIHARQGLLPVELQPLRGLCSSVSVNQMGLGSVVTDSMA